ncbi:MAG: zinc-ribbon domain-containing protein, partial [Planctomycetota bacterium]|nr:zinc-ribbon domain-containing protein [Planctomycetota bacterium]
MIITCPACKAQAKLPDSKEGAKVRCGECDRIYKAVGAGRGTKGPAKTDPTRYFIIGGAVVLLLILFVITKQAPDKPAPVEETVQAEVKPKEAAPEDWTAPSVQMAVKLHELAFAKNKPLLRANLHGQAIFDLQLAEGEKSKDIKLLAPAEQQSILDAAADDILTGDLVADWEPFDGKVIPFEEWTVSMPKDGIVVRLEVAPRDTDSSLLNRNVEWHLIKKGSSYKAFRWMRWLSPEEIAAANKKKRARKYEQTTLSDGSIVIEGKVRVIPYMDETPQEQRDEIDAMIVEMLDPESRPFAIIRKLEEIGKPAIPGLLTHMATTPLETAEQAEGLNLINKTLERITGHRTTFKVSELVGATREK